MSKKLFLPALLLVVAAWGLARLHFDVEVLELLPNRSGVVAGLKQYQSTFLNARELIVAVEGETPEQTEDAARSLAEKLRSRTNLVRQVIWQPLWREKPGLAAEFIAYLWLNQTPAAFSNKVAAISVPTNRAALLENSRELLATSFSPETLAKRAYDPLQLLELPEDFAQKALASSGDTDFFTSPDGLLRLLFVEASSDLASYRQCKRWLEQLQPALQMPENTGVQAHVTGRPVFVSEIAGGMEKDIGGASSGTLATVGFLFFLTHRRLLPMVWLLLTLLAALILTLASAGFLLGSVNVVSIGFAAILAGLAEDYGIVIYEEALGHPGHSVAQLRRLAAPGIFWSAVTTAGAFALLNLSSLPGLAQLGALISSGVVIGALLMLFAYLPLLKRSWKNEPERRFQLFRIGRIGSVPMLLGLTLLIGIGAVAAVIVKPPAFDLSPDALKPRSSPASATLDLIKRKFGGYADPLWMIISGPDEATVGNRLARAAQWLSEQKEKGLVQDYNLPGAIWPVPQNQLANKELLKRLIPPESDISAAAEQAGFKPEAMQLASSILAVWKSAAASDQPVYWPTNQLSHFILGKFSERTATNVFALGLAHPAADRSANARLLREYPSELQKEGIQLSGWPLLGLEMFSVVWKELPRIIALSGALALVSLWLTFRRAGEALLSVAHLLFSLGLLLAVMALCGVKWNLMNLLAFPLLLGLIVDFSIHMQLALRRNSDRRYVQQTTGRALLLAGATTLAGFFSLGFSSNLGLATLGIACGLGTFLGMISAVFLLPAWWEKAGLARKPGAAPLK
jgi:predicted RND superfamily exporter protein